MIFKGRGIEYTGASMIADFLIKKKINRFIFFDFDMTGIGDTLILSESGINLLQMKKITNNSVYNNLQVLRNYATDILLQVNNGQFLNIQTPFSENLALILKGFPVVLISMLPFKEAMSFQGNESSIISIKRTFAREIQNPRLTKIEKSGMVKKYTNELASCNPVTWRNIHSGADSTDKLEKRAFDIMEQFLGKIVEYDIPFKYTYAKAISNTGKIINARSS